MPRPRGVKQVIDRIELSDGDWIDVKRTLTIGEARDMVSAAMVGGEYNHPAYLAARSAAYIQAWSILTIEGVAWLWPDTLKGRIAQLRQLDRDTMVEIETAIDAHETAQEKEKNAPSGEVKPDQTSPSAA